MTGVESCDIVVDMNDTEEGNYTVHQSNMGYWCIVGPDGKHHQKRYATQEEVQAKLDELNGAISLSDRFNQARQTRDDLANSIAHSIYIGSLPDPLKVHSWKEADDKVASIGAEILAES